MVVAEVICIVGVNTVRRCKTVTRRKKVRFCFSMRACVRACVRVCVCVLSYYNKFSDFVRIALQSVHTVFLETAGVQRMSRSRISMLLHIVNVLLQVSALSLTDLMCTQST